MCLLLCASALTGCNNGTSRANAQLRDERREQNEYIAELEQMLEMREDEVEELRRVLEAGGGTDTNPQTDVEPLRLAGIALDRLSGPIDLDGDGTLDAIRAYVKPVDQHLRQTSAIGTARVRLVIAPPDADPSILVQADYTQEEFFEAYRSGFTGPHYTLSLELPDELPETALLQVIFTDAATGLNYLAEQQIVFDPSQAAASE